MAREPNGGLGDGALLVQEGKEALQETFDTSEGAVQITREDSIGGNAIVHRILSPLNFV